MSSGPRSLRETRAEPTLYENRKPQHAGRERGYQARGGAGGLGGHRLSSLCVSFTFLADYVGRASGAAGQ